MKNGKKNAQRQKSGASFWLKSPFGFFSREAKETYFRADLDGFSLASVQSLFAIRNWYEHKYGSEEREAGLLGKPVGPKPLLTTDDLAEICGVDEVPAAFRRCQLCEKLEPAFRKPLMPRYWSTVNAKGEVRRFGNFMWPAHFEGVKTLDKALCFCGLPDPYEQGEGGQTKKTHLFLARSAKVSVLRPCYDWKAIQTVITREERQRVEAADRIAQEKANFEEARKQRDLQKAQQAVENERILEESLKELLGF